MRKLILLLILIFTITITGFAQVVGIGTTTPDSSAQLDVHSANKGFLPPHVALTATNLAAPVNKPATGLLIYNTADTGVAPYNVAPGYYYWTGSKWHAIVKEGNALGDMQYWDGTKWVLLPIGNTNQVLTVCDSMPHWGPCATTTTFAPANNPNEGMYQSGQPTGFADDSDMWVGAWTVGGSPVYSRIAMEFDLSTIPSTVTIDSAKLYLYASPFPNVGDMVNSDYGSADACFIQRITTNWSPSSISWNNPPVTTTVDEATIPQSTSSFQNDIIDVTALLKDIQTNGNYGFAIQLQNENYYNIRQYASSLYSNATLRPKLVVSYH